MVKITTKVSKIGHFSSKNFEKESSEWLMYLFITKLNGTMTIKETTALIRAGIIFGFIIGIFYKKSIILMMRQFTNKFFNRKSQKFCHPSFKKKPKNQK